MNWDIQRWEVHAPPNILPTNYFQQWHENDHPAASCAAGPSRNSDEAPKYPKCLGRSDIWG